MCRPSDIASSILRGRTFSTAVYGVIIFRQSTFGVFITADIHALPDEDTLSGSGVFPFHILDECGIVYNPQHSVRPYRSGDLPPVFSDKGNAYMSVLTNRFSLREVVGKSIAVFSSEEELSPLAIGKINWKYD